MAKIKKIHISDMYCTSCGKKGIPVARTMGQTREAGHLKKLYCIFCKKDTNHAEVRQYGKYTVDIFNKEFQTGRFVNGEKKTIEELETCHNEDCMACINGKCWNSQGNIACQERKRVYINE